MNASRSAAHFSFHLVALVLLSLTMRVPRAAASPSFAMNVPTNPAAPVSCTKTIFIRATPAKVWAVLTAIDAWATWQTDIKNPHLTGPLQPGATFNWKTGGAAIRSTLHTVEPNRAFGWTGKTFGMYAIHNWTLAEAAGGTQVTVDETMEGLLAKLFRASFNRNLATGMQHWLDQLRATAEAQP